MTERPTFTIILRPEPGTDGPRAIRALLKLALRTFGLRCVAIAEAPANSEQEELE